MLRSCDQARDFFEQLAEFSRRYVAAELKLSSAISVWGSPAYHGAGPAGAVIHYTADDDLSRVLRWFLTEKYQARCSAHVVVADRRLASQEEHAHDLPLVLELPATVVQVRHPHTQAWHATWVNGRCYGIENLNVGPLKHRGYSETKDTPQFASWRPRDRSTAEWTMPWSSPYKEAVYLYGRWWSPYTPEQIESNVMVLRHLQALFGSLTGPWVLGHDAVQGRQTAGARGRNKLDPGPSYPIHGVRKAVFDGWLPVGRYPWFWAFCSDLEYGRAVRDQEVVDYVRREGSMTSHPPPAIAWAKFESAIRVFPEKKGFGLVGKTALRLLGYNVDLSGVNLDSDELVSVWIFQRMSGLTTDSQPGPITKRAIVERLEDRGIL